MTAKHFLPFSLVFLAAFASCGEDRSGEQPFAPTVETVGVEVLGDSARVSGLVTASLNSSLTECGITYGNDTLRATAKAPAPTTSFAAVTDSLGAGDYFAVPYAHNGVGTSYGDTVHFRIE